MLNLNFASAIPGTFLDKDGEGTGFTYVQSDVNGEQYDPSRINLDTTAGTLVLTATQGSNTSANTLKNALQVGIDATQTFTVSTRLQGSLTNLSTAVQQGGLVIGPNQDNYAKLVAINTGKDLRIQFFKEENGLGSIVGEITGLDWANIKTLDLYLTGDPVTNTITAAYRVDSNTAAPIPLTQNFQPDQTASFFADAASSRAGILAFTKDAVDVPVTFNYFGIAQDVKINFGPSTAAVIDGYVTDSGEAYDATRGFGWVTQDSLSLGSHIPLSIASYAWQRNLTDVDPRLNTVLHMQYPNTPAAAWEYAVPNGTYNVTVSVGDQPGSDGVYDSIHTINVEGVNAINGFQSTPNQEYQLATVQATVSDGRLTVDAIGGSNTKLNYLELVNITPGQHPSVSGSSIKSDATGVYRDSAVNVDVSLPTVGAGVDQETLNTTNVQLYRTKDNVLVPGDVVTNEGGDAIVYQPSVLLEPNTNYTFSVTSGVTESSGATFIPYSTTFNTGINSTVGNLKINFGPSTAVVPAGYIAESGEAYDPTRGFGWVTQDSLSLGSPTPLSIADYGLQGNRIGVDPRLDTVLQMQYPNTAAAAWEYALPNRTYSVTVGVGDQPRSDGVYDSIHTINVEGVNAINGFQSTPNQEYQLATVTVNVSDGKLTVDAIGGTNTKLNYLEIVNITPGNHPSVSGSAIDRDATGVYLDAAVDVDVSLPTVGAGVDQETLDTTNVQLYRTKDNVLVPGTVGTTGGGDAIVYQPSMRLEPNTNYTFRITSGVSDESGATFIPYTTTFNTGTNAIVPIDPRVNFTKSTVYTGDPISSLAISPDGNQLYAASLDGKLSRWTIDSSGNLTNLQTFSPSEITGRAIIGLAFDPNDANNLWLTHNDPLFPTPADDFSGKISKLTLDDDDTNFNADIQDYAFGLPRSSKDHLTESLAFGPDGKLYVSQGSNSAMGAPDPGWYNRPERLLSGTVLQLDPTLTPPLGGFNLQTENYKNTIGSYNPYDTDAPVKIYATGLRNAYDLVWHSNGNLYAPTNGSAAGGNTPDDPATPVNEGLTDVGTQNDYLFKIVQAGYYGHPNPTRQEYIMNGGNPTLGVDPAEVVEEVTSTGTVYAGYPVGIQPDLDYQGVAYDFGRNRSPNGAIEYQSDTFGGALKNKLLVVEYSGGDDILALAPDASGNIPRGNVTQVISGLTDPLDLVEDTKNNVGNLYVAELIDGGTSGQISLLKGI